MQKTTGRLLLLSILLGCVGSLLAQDQATTPPKVLVVIREFLKPGKTGTLHARMESAFVNAFAAAKWPQHYLAMDSLSGPPRSLFFVGYDSFASWEKDSQATAKNAALSAALDRASAADGELLSSYESTTFVYNEEQSYQASVDVATMRYFEITLFRVKPGHEHDWASLVKMYKENYPKAVPDARWAVYEDAYGQDSGGVYIVITPLKSLAEVDTAFGNSKKFAAAMGEEGMKKLSELVATAVDSVSSNLFQFNPRMSYPPDQWIKSDPSFWKPTAAAAAKKAESKPAQ